MRFRSVLAAAASAAIGCAGCSTADRDARNLAEHTLQTVVAYEAEVQKKIDAENGFYRTQVLNLRQGLIGQTDLPEPVVPAAGTAPTTAPVRRADVERERDRALTRRSLLYGRIAVNADREARVAAEQLVTAGSPQIMTAIIGVVSRGIKDDADFYRDLAARDHRLTVDFLASLNKIEFQKSYLAQVREQLTVLAAQADAGDQIKILQQHGEAALAEVKRRTPTTEPSK